MKSCLLYLLQTEIDWKLTGTEVIKLIGKTDGGGLTGEDSELELSTK